MKSIGHFESPLHGDISGQIGVGAADPRVSVAVQFGVKVHHLHEAVHTGIGATGAQSGNALGGELAQRGFEFVLDGETGRLALPALVGPTVVANT